MQGIDRKSVIKKILVPLNNIIVNKIMYIGVEIQTVRIFGPNTDNIRNIFFEYIPATSNIINFGWFISR